MYFDDPGDRQNPGASRIYWCHVGRAALVFIIGLYPDRDTSSPERRCYSRCSLEPSRVLIRAIISDGVN